MLFANECNSNRVLGYYAQVEGEKRDRGVQDATGDEVYVSPSWKQPHLRFSPVGGAMAGESQMGTVQYCVRMYRLVSGPFSGLGLLVLGHFRKIPLVKVMDAIILPTSTRHPYAANRTTFDHYRNQSLSLTPSSLKPDDTESLLLAIESSRFV